MYGNGIRRGDALCVLISPRKDVYTYLSASSRNRTRSNYNYGAGLMHREVRRESAPLSSYFRFERFAPAPFASVSTASPSASSAGTAPT